jgi:hypothetical protein
LKNSESESRQILLVDNHFLRLCQSCNYIDDLWLIGSIGFLKEFTPGSTSGTSTPSDKSNGAAYKGKAKDKKYSASEAFIPETVYDALKGLSRFDALRVSASTIRDNQS